MRSFALKPVFLLIAFFVSEAAHAVDSSSAFESVPDRFRSSELTLGARGLGEICLSRDFMPDGTVCNPAFLAEAPGSQLLGRIFVGNGYAALDTANTFVNETLTKEDMQRLFEKDSAVMLEAHFGVVFVAKNFSAGFSPYRVQYAQEVHNPNLPVVSLHGAIERSMFFAYGDSLGGIAPELAPFSAGARVRVLERKFVHGEFSLIEATLLEPRDYLPTRKQTAVLIDPSLGWVPPEAPWKLRFSISAYNLGHASEEFPEYPNYVDFGVGIGAEPPVRFGKFRVGLDAVDLVDAPTLIDRIRFGASYKAGLMESMLGLRARTFSGGIMFSLSVVQAGVVYEFVRDDLNDQRLQTRIATEVSIRL